mmetsp:Transcript_13653/g.36931  ORF Transcript_13653/g.36931 Transcript_13653/m.36931 type:complete len:101 (+) Transcript_13653:50-352(+)
MHEASLHAGLHGPLFSSSHLLLCCRAPLFIAAIFATLSRWVCNNGVAHSPKKPALHSALAQLMPPPPKYSKRHKSKPERLLQVQGSPARCTSFTLKTAVL